jgi:L-2-hydroxyglutarate oxidase
MFMRSTVGSSYSLCAGDMYNVGDVPAMLSEKRPMRYDLTLIGSGIVGLSTAHHILKAYPGTRLMLLEKESGPAHHQSGHNSGVIHSGIYYTPGSMKALFAKRGGAAMSMFCREHGIAYDLCGKVVVATEQ